MKILCVGTAGFCNSLHLAFDSEQTQVLRAVTLAEACRLVAGTPDIGVIVLDDRNESLQFAHEVRRTSPVLMYVCSPCENIGSRFVAAGCHSCLPDRRQLAEALRDATASLCC